MIPKFDNNNDNNMIYDLPPHANWPIINRVKNSSPEKRGGVLFFQKEGSSSSNVYIGEAVH